MMAWTDIRRRTLPTAANTARVERKIIAQHHGLSADLEKKESHETPPTNNSKNFPFIWAWPLGK
ncbi:MAG: hypothetical protein R2825_10155 [Saprospiraceae bacterium]